MEEKEFEKKLKEKHPSLFKLLHEPRVPGVPMWSIQWGLEIGEGWYPIIEELCEKIQVELNKLEDSSLYYVLQIKQKFGGLRFYMNASNDAINELISEAERKADAVCEKCSKPGTVQGIGNWLNCFCPEHKELRKKEVEERNARFQKN